MKIEEGFRRYVQIMSIILIYNDKWRIIMVNNSNKCPECGSRKIITKEAPYFGGVLIDYICRECGYAWHQDVKKSVE